MHHNLEVRKQHPVCGETQAMTREHSLLYGQQLI